VVRRRLLELFDLEWVPVVKAALVSFRLGAADGVSVAAGSLVESLHDLGFEVVTVAGEGRADRIVTGLSRSAGVGPDLRALRRALADADLVLVENLLTLPLHPAASQALARVLAGRPAIVRHHDPPWQRERFRHLDEGLADDSMWLHAAVCDHTRDELVARGIRAHTLRVGVREPACAIGRAEVRNRLGVAEHETLCIHPVRAIARKEIPTALELTRRLGGIYWLTGPAEEGYGAQVREHLESAGVRTIWRGFDDVGLDSAYAAADLVLFPSSWEGFGIPPIEAALRRRLVVVGDYPVAEEFRALGFHWPGVGEVGELRRLLADDIASTRLVERNLGVVRDHFTRAAQTRRLAELLGRRGWLPADVSGRAM
jgi:glycosyltransferase involved in cell wall biosynthesis